MELIDANDRRDWSMIALDHNGGPGFGGSGKPGHAFFGGVGH
jgi:hypothetical protein